jgi:hypothetical protein
MDAIADNPEFTKGKTYLHFKQNWPSYQKALMESFDKEYSKALKDNDPIRADKLLEAMKVIEADKTGAIIDQAMPGTAEAIRAEQATGRVIPYGQTKEGVMAKLKAQKEAAQIRAGAKETKQAKDLKSIKSSYEKAIGRANAARRGENIMSEALGEKGPEVAAQEYKRSWALVQQYSTAGGDIKNLGITPEQIREAYQSKIISKDAATKLLTKHF